MSTIDTLDSNDMNMTPPDTDMIEAQASHIQISDDRLRALYLYQMLLQYTDEDHPLTTKQIQKIFEERYQIKIHRTIVPEYIELLRVAGVDIVGQRKRSFNYYLAYRDFSIPELKILIDAVQSSKFITEKKSRELIHKLTTMTCKANADQLRRSTHISDRAKSDNEKGYYIVDSINTAIHTNKKVSFTAFDYGQDKKPLLKNQGRPYTVSPYDLIWDGDFYYMIGFCDERNQVRTFRLDRLISVPKVLMEDALPRPENYRVEHYTRESFRMFSSTLPTEVTLLCENAAMNAIIDQFGNDIPVEKAGFAHFRVTCRVCTGPTFYRWVFGWNGQIRIEAPLEIREDYRQTLAQALTLVDMPELVPEPEPVEEDTQATWEEDMGDSPTSLAIGHWYTQHSAGYWQLIDIKPRYATSDFYHQRGREIVSWKKGDLLGHWAIVKKAYSPRMRRSIRLECIDAGWLSPVSEEEALDIRQHLEEDPKHRARFEKTRAMRLNTYNHFMKLSQEEAARLEEALTALSPSFSDPQWKEAARLPQECMDVNASEANYLLNLSMRNWEITEDFDQIYCRWELHKMNQ